MIKDLEELTKTLDTKVKPLVDEIKKEDPTSERFGKLLENFGNLLMISSNINRTLYELAMQVQKAKGESNGKDSSSKSE